MPTGCRSPAIRSRGCIRMSPPGRRSSRARPEFAKEIAMPPEVTERLEATRRAQAAGKSLELVAGF